MKHQQGKEDPVKHQQRKKTMYSLSLVYFSSGGHLVQPSRPILEILVKGRKRIISVKLF